MTLNFSRIKELQTNFSFKRLILKSLSLSSLKFSKISINYPLSHIFLSQSFYFIPINPFKFSIPLHSKRNLKIHNSIQRYHSRHFNNRIPSNFFKHHHFLPHKDISLLIEISGEALRKSDLFDHRGTYYGETIWRSDIVAARKGGVEWREEMKGQATRLFEMERRNAKLGADTEKDGERSGGR